MSKKQIKLKENVFNVCVKPCQNCLLSPNSLVSSQRRKQLLTTIAKESGHFICHVASTNNLDVCCSTFYKSGLSNKVRMAARFDRLFPGFVEKVDLSTLDSKKPTYLEMTRGRKKVGTKNKAPVR